MPSMTDPQPGLTLGGLDLLGRDKTGPYWFETIGDDHDPGNPQGVERTIASLLQDGSIVSVDSYDNREMVFHVAVCAEDSPGLAAGELALMAEVRRRNVLTYTPANIITGSGDPCVFDVVNSEPAFSFDDVLEMNSLQRVYTLTIKALPHARSPIQRTAAMVAPAPTGPTVATVNDCTSLTGWTASSNPSSGHTLVTSGGSVKADWVNQTNADATSPSAFLGVGLSGLSVNMTSTPYVRIDFSYGGSGRYGSQILTVTINGAYVQPVASNGSVAWYKFTGTTLNTIGISTEAQTSRYGKLFIYVADVSRSSLPQDAAGSRQLFGTVGVDGSVRTDVTLSVRDATPAALGSVLVYTAPNVGTVTQPPLRARRVAGSTETTDTSLVSGKSSDLGTLHSFEIPAAQVPDGNYLLMARVKNASAGTYAIAWTAKARMGGSDVGSSVTGTRSVTVAAATWTLTPVASIPLPTQTLGSLGVVRIDISAPAGLLLDEAWLFNTTTGQLSWVECGTGTPAAGGSASRLWLDPASLENPSALVTIGTAADRSDAFTPATGSLLSWMNHQFVPPSMSMFVVTTNSLSMEVDAAYYARFHSHVIESS